MCLANNKRGAGPRLIRYRIIVVILLIAFYIYYNTDNVIL